ncbi:hypothetical protein Plec18167_007841 [Paecilomyces lecythidis]|uniref:Uncharacterized protein n=1 Tax=Paecilomyces lecythidis TaxID=3004212 RepID=A0ABR3X105_9EURO
MVMPSSDLGKGIMRETFGIQFETAETYLVGTKSQHIRVSFDELMSFFGGVVALLDYGVTWRVIRGILQRWRRPGWNELEGSDPVWIDNSGPVFYEIRHGPDSIKVAPSDLESSRFGMVIKRQWDDGMTARGNLWVAKIVIQALFSGLCRRTLAYLRLKSVGGL